MHLGRWHNDWMASCIRASNNFDTNDSVSPSSLLAHDGPPLLQQAQPVLQQLHPHTPPSHHMLYQHGQPPQPLLAQPMQQQMHQHNSASRSIDLPTYATTACNIDDVPQPDADVAAPATTTTSFANQLAADPNGDHRATS